MAVYKLQLLMLKPYACSFRRAMLRTIAVMPRQVVCLSVCVPQIRRFVDNVHFKWFYIYLLICLLTYIEIYDNVAWCPCASTAFLYLL